jgi:hypothetical protein
MAADSAVFGLPDGGGPDCVRFRATRRQLLPALIVPLPVLAEQIIFWSLRPRPLAGVLKFDLICCAVFMLAFGLQLRWYGATLTPSGVLVHSIRRRTVAWHDLAAIRVERLTGTRTPVLYERDGRRTRLRMPATGPLFRDPDFDAKVQLIHDYWSRYSAGPVLAADRPAFTGFGGRPDRPRARPAWTQKLMVGYLCSVFALEVSVSSLLDDQGYFHPTAMIVAAAAGIAALLAISQWCVRSGVTLTPDALIVHGVRRRRITWHDLQAVSLRRRLGGAALVVTERDGRQYRLPCPRTGLLLWDGDFGAKAMTLQRWWVEHRGDAWPAPGLTSEQTAYGLGLDDVAVIGIGWRRWKAIVLGLILSAITIELLVLLVVGLVTVLARP